MTRLRQFLLLIMRGALAFGLTANAGSAHGADPLDPSGTWLTEDGRARIKIERCGPRLDQVCGYIVWMNDPVDKQGQPVKDLRNPDPAKRGRPVLGHQLIMGLAVDPEGRFAGQIYNAEDGKSYGVAIWRETAESLKVKGCMLSIFCATQTWKSTNDVLQGQLVGLTGDQKGPRPDKEWTMQPKLPTTVKAAR